MTYLHVARARALAAHGHGERGEASGAALRELYAAAEQAGLRTMLPALQAALDEAALAPAGHGR